MGERMELSVPSTRVYAMKRGRLLERLYSHVTFSTLDSGLRDETQERRGIYCPRPRFQYPRLGSTR